MRLAHLPQVSSRDAELVGNPPIAQIGGPVPARGHRHPVDPDLRHGLVQNEKPTLGPDGGGGRDHVDLSGLLPAKQCDSVLKRGVPRSKRVTGNASGHARRRHHRDRPLGLSEPGQQCPRLSLYLPRRARRARQDDQYGNEDRRGSRARRSRARGRARRSRGRLSGRAAALRARLHHPGSVRSAPHPRHPDRRRQGGDGVGRRAPADRRHGRL